MSNHLAIAATTAALRRLLSTEIANVTARPLDKARDPGTDQVNLFLYHSQVDAAWRNQDMPGKAKPGETGRPPLPLNLFYLVTAFQDDKDDVKAQALLGQAMSILHSHPVLGAAEIKDALAGSDLHEQIERIRVTLHPLSVEEMTKLWTVFQTQYRMSAAYQASVVLIESTRPAKAPLPVLRRGEDDRGVASQADLESPFPALTGIVLPNGQASARLGDTVTITGQNLAADNVEVRITNPHLPDPGPVVISPLPTDTEIKVEISNNPALWVAGLYTVTVVLTRGTEIRTTNELPLTVAPRLQITQPFQVVRHPVQHWADIQVKFRPRFRPGQRAVLLVGDREVRMNPPEGPNAPANKLDFRMEAAPLGKHFLRLRIDGVDSLLVERPPGQPPVFDTDQRVEIL